MAKLFYSLGKMAGPSVRKGRWLWRSLTGSEAEIIEAEHEVGRDMARALAEQMPPDSDPGTQKLLDEMGGRLASRLTNKARRFTFRVVAADEANAWALPGGFIFVTRALIELCERDPHEIAFILGHEAGHVVRGHAMDRILNSTLLSAASRAAPAGRVLTPRVVQMGVQFLQKAYSRDQELEADEFGARLTASGGFDPQAAVRMMMRLQAKAGAGAEEPLFVYFSTHPAFGVRIAALRRLLKR